MEQNRLLTPLHIQYFKVSIIVFNSLGGCNIIINNTIVIVMYYPVMNDVAVAQCPPATVSQ
jgi:hypothetical protein